MIPQTQFFKLEFQLQQTQARKTKPRECEALDLNL